ncbi:MAG: pentapeptide repeat-containing protein [Cyanobacteria bacterium P01_D01_bin.116]
MANEKHLAILKQGVKVWNQWRKNNRGIVPVLSEVNLTKENLCGADLNWANLRHTNLNGANLSGANLSRANLEKADLSGANLSGANLSDAKLEYAKFRCAQISVETLIQEKWRMVLVIMNDGAAGKNFSKVDLSKADLSGANLSGANLSGADLSKVDLRNANLRSANLLGANITGADITGADIYKTNFNQANITRLIGASFNIEEFYEVVIYRDISHNCPSAGPVRDKIDFSKKLLSLASPVSDKGYSLSKKKPIPGIILYTEQDELSHYIKSYFEYIDTLSGDDFHIYLLEKPPLKWKKSNLSWKEILEFYLHKLIPIFHWCRRIKNKPYSKSEVYDIARQWRIDINNIPCLVLFNPKNVSEKIIFNIDINISKNSLEYYFRDLFSELERRVVISNSQSQQNLQLDSYATFNKIKIEFMSIIGFLENKYSKKEIDGGTLQQTIYDLRNTTFAGGLVNANTVHANQIGGNITNHASEHRQNIVEVAKEIEALLQHLQQSYPSTTSAEKMAIVAKAVEEIEKNSTLKGRVIGALKAGGTEAIKEFVDNPLINHKMLQDHFAQMYVQKK